MLGKARTNSAPDLPERTPYDTLILAQRDWCWALTCRTVNLCRFKLSLWSFITAAIHLPPSHLFSHLPLLPLPLPSVCALTLYHSSKAVHSPSVPSKGPGASLRNLRQLQLLLLHANPAPLHLATPTPILTSLPQAQKSFFLCTCPLKSILQATNLTSHLFPI